MSRKESLLPATLCLFLGCGFGAEGNFTAGLSEDRCEDTFPICQTTAGCTMGTGRYVSGSFPGAREFIVPAPAEATIKLSIFFKSQMATGANTDIRFHEPGCFDTYQFLSDGRDIFLQAGNDRVFETTQQIFLDGDHLVEVFSDAVAEYILKIEVEAPGGS